MVDLNKLAKPNKKIREHTDDLLQNLEVLNQFNYIKAEDYKLLKYCCEYHDYGKINDEFQKRVSSAKKLKFDNCKEVMHNVLSLCFVEQSKFKDKEHYYKVCYAILNHHHYTDNFKEFNNKEELIERFIEKYGGNKISRRILKGIARQKTDNQAIYIKGLLHKCDYAASGNYIIEYKNDFLIDGLNNLLSKWQKDNKTAKWNDLQEYCIKKRNKNIIVVANTGMGKTEAGLLWIGNNKGFFILPLRTAINAIYDRIRKNIALKEIENKVSLLHSDTLAYYLKESVTEEEKIIEYTNKGKNLSMPLTITTLDQLFNFVYKYNGFELKLATLSYSKIVIDEIQAYSPDLLAYLILGVEKVTQLGGKFAVLTATLPPFVKDYIEKAVGKVDFAKFTEGETRHNLEVYEEEINSQIVTEHFIEKGGKILIICNTVKKAQEIYGSLFNDLKGEEVNLIHSKYIKKDRKDKEDKIIDFGRTEVKGNGVWVATSIVEASLDIDFDYLFTELNDLNGLFQRIGRVNRKGLKKHMLKEPNVYVFTEINKNILTNESGTKGFIDKQIYEISKNALLENKGLMPECKKMELIEINLTTKKIRGSNFDRSYNCMREYIEKLYIGEKDAREVQEVFRNITSYDIIPEEVYVENKSLIDEQFQIANEDFAYDKEQNYEQNNKIRNDLFLRRIKAREKINEYTVSVGIYDLSRYERHNVIKEEICIIKCKYDSNMGFERTDTAEEIFDRFY
jgi:CRISPR-associated endonuclease/helicase Cas3